MFGNVPLVTSGTYDPANLPKQATRAEIYNFIKTELTELKSSLPATNTYGRVDRYAAEALLAKLYLNSGIYLGSQSSDDLNQVVSLTTDIMFLRGTSSNALEGTFAPYPLEEVSTREFYSQKIVTKRAGYIAHTRGNRNYPWRVLMIASEDKELPMNDM